MALLLAVSCAKEQALPPAAERDTETIQTSETRTIKVRFDEATAEIVAHGLAEGGLTTRSDEVNSAISMSGVVSMERLFSYAGEYEERTRREGLDRWYKIVYDASLPETRAKDNFASLPGVEIVQGERKIKSTAIFNDPRFSSQWDMYDGKTPTYSVNAEPVWRNYTTGSDKVIVGVVDGGISLSHEDLAWNCIAGGSNGSRNFITGGYNITGSEHGTHVAGTIAAVNNNGKGISGIAGGDYATGSKGVRLMSCQIFDDNSDKTGDTEAAIKWAADHGAVIVNNSWGYSFDYNDDGKLTGEELQNALDATIEASDKAAVDYFIKYAGCDSDGNQLPDSPMKGGVVIFAAGNDGIANGAPANYAPVIAVGATTRNGARSSYSNYGDWVDICAPGGDAYYTNILSTLPGNSYGSMAGTSMACPHVTGVAALIVSYFGGPGFTNTQLEERLLSGANLTVIPASGRIGPLVDALGSFSHSMSAPAPVEDLTLSSTGNVIDVSFEVTADSSGVAAYSYIVAASEDKDKISGFTPTTTDEGVKTVTVNTNGKKPGEELSALIEDLGFSTNYYVAIVGSTYTGLYSGLSPIKSISTGENGKPVITPSEPGPYTIKAADVKSLKFTISDPENHSMEIDVEEGSPALTYYYHASELQIILRGRNAEAGTYTAAITVTDKYGAEAVHRFEYTILPNHAPVVTQAIEDILSYDKVSTFTIDMSKHFSDEDGDELTYMVRNFVASAKGNEVSYSGSTMTVKISEYGLYTMDVVASDGAGKECRTPLRILVKNKTNPVETYPNPVTDKLTIRTERNAETRIKVTSPSGIVIYDETREVSGYEPVSLNMLSCAPGIYSLTVSYDGKEYKKSIVKK